MSPPPWTTRTALHGAVGGADGLGVDGGREGLLMAMLAAANYGQLRKLP